jgi:hypothetical protein
VLVARRPGGRGGRLPGHRDGPARRDLPRDHHPRTRPRRRARRGPRGAGRRIADELGVVGILAVELMERPDGEIVVNELAMRPHNTGHWSIEGAVTSQFENHLRAVADLPLGSAALRAPVAVMTNVLGGANPDLVGSLNRVLSRPGRPRPPVRQGGQARPQGRPRHRARRRRGRRPAFAARAAAADPGRRMSMTEPTPVVGIVMGSDSDWPTMEAAALALRRVRRRLRGRRRLRAPDARGDGRATAGRRTSAA